MEKAPGDGGLVWTRYLWFGNSLAIPLKECVSQGFSSGLVLSKICIDVYEGHWAWDY